MRPRSVESPEEDCPRRRRASVSVIRDVKRPQSHLRCRHEPGVVGPAMRPEGTTERHDFHERLHGQGIGF